MSRAIAGAIAARRPRRAVRWGIQAGFRSQSYPLRAVPSGQLPARRGAPRGQSPSTKTGEGWAGSTPGVVIDEAASRVTSASRAESIAARSRGSTRRDPTPESLESRTLLAGNGLSQAELTAILTGPLSKDHHLAELYANFRQGPEFLQKGIASRQGLIVFRGDKVGVDVFGGRGGLRPATPRPSAIWGWRSSPPMPRNGVVEGFLPIGQLQTVAQSAPQRRARSTDRSSRSRGSPTIRPSR